MRRTVLILLALAVAAPAVAQAPDRVRVITRTKVETTRAVLYQGRDREEQTERISKTVRIGSDGELSLGNIAGDIVITRSGASDATIEIVKTARGRTADDAREMLKLVEVEVTERGSRAEVKTRYPDEREMRRNNPNRRNINVSVAYTVSAPSGTRITANSISGNLKATDIKGDLTLTTISGTVRIANAGRIAAAKSVSGEVEIVDTQIDGGVQAESISGGITMRRVQARRLELSVISGNVVLQDIKCDRVEAHSISGDVEYRGELAKNGRYNLTSHSGDVRIAISGDIGFELDANSFSGSVRSDLPLTLRGRNSDDRGRRRALHGIYGDGSAVLDVTTFSGGIVISKR